MLLKSSLFVRQFIKKKNIELQQLILHSAENGKGLLVKNTVNLALTVKTIVAGGSVNGNAIV